MINPENKMRPDVKEFVDLIKPLDINLSLFHESYEYDHEFL
jgi:hypothetical protein